MSGAERTEVERYRAALSLSSLLPPVVFDSARESLGDEAWRVRRAAWEAVCRSAASLEQRLAFFVGCLEDSENAGIRGAAGEALIFLGKSAVPFLCRSLSQASERGRKAILDILVQIGDRAAGPAALQTLLSDVDENVRFSAAELVGTVGTRDEAERLLALVNGMEGSDRFAALTALVQIARREGLTVEGAALRESLADPIFAIPAIQLLGCSGNQDGLRLLWDMVSDQWPLDTLLAALGEGLARYPQLTLVDAGDRLAVVHRRVRADAVPSRLRRAAFAVTTAVAPLKLAEIVSSLLDEPDDAEWLAGHLRERPSEIVRGVLSALVRKPNGKRIAALLLAERPELDGEAILLSLLSEGGDHRRETLAALGRVGTLRAVPHLMAACGDGDRALAETAAESLLTLADKRLTGMSDLLAMGVTEWRAEVVVLMLPAVGRLPAEQSVPILTQAMRHADGQVRRAAVLGAVGAVERAEILQILHARLSDEDDEVRSAAASVLGESGAREAAGPLSILLDDENPWVQAAALRALSNLGCPPEDARLLELLRQGGVVATAAAWVAGQHVRQEMFPSLAEAIDRLDDYPTAELLKSLAWYESDLQPGVLGVLLRHPSWPVRGAAAAYITHKKTPWMVEMARERIGVEEDGLVRMHLEQLAGD